jgi:Na+-transporting methylmalonyl-CoA/oxaloacetate decarboxylase gamma subunit
MTDVFDGLFLMCVGMGTVFVFLGLMIGSTEVIRLMFGSPAAPKSPSPPSGPRSGGRDEALETAVVTAALLHHRRPR